MKKNNEVNILDYLFFTKNGLKPMFVNNKKIKTPVDSDIKIIDVSIKLFKTNATIFLSNGLYIKIFKIKNSYYLRIDGIKDVLVSQNVYKLISYAIVIDELYQNVNWQNEINSERLYLYKAAKEKSLLKDKNGINIDYKIVKENINTNIINGNKNIVTNEMKKYENKIIQVYKCSGNSNEVEYTNRDLINEFNDDIFGIKKNDKDIYYWTKDFLLPLDKNNNEEIK